MNKKKKISDNVRILPLSIIALLKHYFDDLFAIRNKALTCVGMSDMELKKIFRTCATFQGLHMD